VDQVELKHRWRTMSYQDRYDAIFGTPPAPQTESAPELSGLRALIKPGPAIDPEERAHSRRFAQAYTAIQRELEREAEQTAQAQRDAHMAFRRESALGQLL
jgi:hypothetical protein